MRAAGLRKAAPGCLQAFHRAPSAGSQPEALNSDPCSAPSQLQEAGSLTGKRRRWAGSSLGSQSSSNIWFRVCNTGETQLQTGILVNNYNFGLWLWLVPPRKHHAAHSPSVLWATSSHKRLLKRVEDSGEVCLPGPCFQRRTVHTGMARL